VAENIEWRKERMRRYYQKNRAVMDARMEQWRHYKRLEFIDVLGGKCVSCGESNPVVLDFDHIHNDGAEHRRSTGRLEIIRFFSKHGVDKSRFQLLCKNCNWIKEYKRRKDALKKQSPAQSYGDGGPRPEGS